MDKSTSKTLQKINMQEAMKYQKDFVKNEDIFESERELLEKQLAKPNITAEEKKRIGILLDNPGLHETKQVINEEATKKIESNVEKRIRLAIKSGKLKPVKRDAFMRKQMAWAERKQPENEKAIKYRQFMETTLKTKKFTESWQRDDCEKQMIKYGKEQGFL